MNQYLIQFSTLKLDTWNPYCKILLVTADNFEDACSKIIEQYPDAKNFDSLNL